MRIRFLGLAIHIENAGGIDFVALPKHTDHEPVLRVRMKDIVGQSDSDPNVRCEVLSGKTLSFFLAGPVDRKGLAGVPSLKKIGGGTVLDPDIAVKSTAGDFDAFVELPGGDYGVEDWFEHHGWLKSHGLMCVPMTVVVETRATAPVTVTAPGLTLLLHPWATITITNIEKQNAAPATGQFGVYGKLFVPEINTFMMAEDPSLCDHGLPAPNYPKCPKEQQQSFGVECSNSQYP